VGVRSSSPKIVYNGDEMMKSEITGGVTLNHSYDGDGQRLEKSNGKIRRFD
jgi:hypothetical protein